MSEGWSDIYEVIRQDAELRERQKRSELPQTRKEGIKRETRKINTRFEWEAREVVNWTKNDIKKFQEENGLTPDGIVWRKTLAKIAERKNPRSPSQSAPQEKWFFERIFWSFNSEQEEQTQSPTKTSKRPESWIDTREQNKQFISENVPYGWKDIAIKSLRHLKSGEVYTKETPVLLFDTNSSRWILIYNGNSNDFPISVSQYGTLKREISRWWDHKTPTDWLQRFSSVYIAPTEDGDASRSRKWADRGVTSARIESREADGLWQRWVHGMKIWDSTAPATIGCIAIDNRRIRPIAKVVQTALARWSKAYGYTA